MANPSSLKPFTKGDKRINRDGRPKNSGELGALFRRIGHEIATDKSGNPVIGPDGKPMTIVEVIARQKAQDKKYQSEFLGRGWGKVPTPVTGADGGAIEHVVRVMLADNLHGHNAAEANADASGDPE